MGDIFDFTPIETPMWIGDALKIVGEGGKVARLEWNPGMYISAHRMLEGSIFLHFPDLPRKIFSYEEVGYFVWVPKIIDIITQDWVDVSEVIEVVE